MERAPKLASKIRQGWHNRKAGKQIRDADRIDLAKNFLSVAQLALRFDSRRGLYEKRTILAYGAYGNNELLFAAINFIFGHQRLTARFFDLLPCTNLEGILVAACLHS